MNRDAILQFLRANKPFFHQEMGVKSIGLFGSYARGTAKPQSDIDILVDMATPDFQNLMLLQAFLEKHFAIPVDLLRLGPHLRTQFLKSIESELIYA